jgi:hypothetical protein
MSCSNEGRLVAQVGFENSGILIRADKININRLFMDNLRIVDHKGVGAVPSTQLVKTTLLKARTVPKPVRKVGTSARCTVLGEHPLQ